MEHILDGDFTARVLVVDDFRTDVRSPNDRLRHVFRSETVHVGDQFFHRVDRNALSGPLSLGLDLDVGLAGIELDRLALAKAKITHDLGGDAHSEAVPPACKLGLHHSSPKTDIRPISVLESLHPLLAAAHRGDAGARDFGKADRGHELDEALDLVRGPGELEHEGAEGGVEDAGPEGRGEAHRLHPVLAGAADLEERGLALDRLALARQIVYPVHGPEPLELALD